MDSGLAGERIDAAEHPAPDPYPTSLTDRQRRVLVVLAVVGVTAPIAITALVLTLNSASGVTIRQFWLLTHLAFGVVMVHGFAGGLATLVTRHTSRVREAIRLASTASLATVSWLAVLSGTWMVYPGYRATPADGAVLNDYPREYLLRGDQWLWHVFGMEWKEHIAWLTPFLATAVAFVAYRYGDLVNRNQRVRTVTTAFFIIAFVGAVVAAGLGAAINTIAPNDFLKN